MIIIVKDKGGNDVARCEVFRDDEYDMLRRGNSDNCAITFDWLGDDDRSDEAIIIKINQVIK